MRIPGLVLRQLYTFGSLAQDAAGLSFGLKNRLADATLIRVIRISINGVEIPLAEVTVDHGDGEPMPAGAISADHPRPFALPHLPHVRGAQGRRLDPLISRS